MQTKLIIKNDPTIILRIGLALVFISNFLMPFLAPYDYADLVNHSFLGQIFHVNSQTFGIFTGINDAIVGSLLILGLCTRYVTAYACFWIVGVMTVYGTGRYLDVLEHVGFLSIAVYLLIVSNQSLIHDRLKDESGKKDVPI